MKRNLIFFSYSHTDSGWLKKIQIALKPAIQKDLVSTWADTDIEPGKKWKEEIANALTSAKIAVLLVSPEFLASDFITNHELPDILESAEKEGLAILWVYVRACMYKFTEIADYQATHNITLPLRSLSPAKQDLAIIEICNKILEAYSGDKKNINNMFQSADIYLAPKAVILR